MSIENVTYALQVKRNNRQWLYYASVARTPAGHIQDHGQRISHSWRNHYRVLPPKYTYSPGVWVSGSNGLGGTDYDCCSAECHDRLLCRERVRHVPREDKHAHNGRNCHGPRHSARGTEGLEPMPLVSFKKNPARHRWPGWKE